MIHLLGSTLGNHHPIGLNYTLSNIPKHVENPWFPQEFGSTNRGFSTSMLVSFPQLKLAIGMIGFSATHLSCNNS